MNINDISVEDLVYIAMMSESEHPIDWGMLAINEEDAYRLMALNVLELYKDADLETLLASIVKLTVENFALTLKNMNT